VLLAAVLLALEIGFSYPLSAAVPPKATITLLSSAEVQGIDILLGDIAEIEYHLEEEDAGLKQDLAKIPVGRAPLPGKSRKINVGSIEVRLRQAGIHPSTVAIIPPPEGEVLVTAAFQNITEEMVIAAVREHLNENLGDSFEIGVQAASELPLVVPAGEVELRIDAVPSRFGSYQVGVMVYVDGRWYRTAKVRIQLQPRRLAAAATAEEEYGSSIPAQSSLDVKGEFPILDEPLDMTAGGGGDQPILVRVGEPVIIEVVSGSIRVEALGRARQSGKLGDMIRVENVDSRKIITARVVEKGIVRLDLGLGN
jgi:flagella basal body P-ring formation protein FlgA